MLFVFFHSSNCATIHSFGDHVYHEILHFSSLISLFLCKTEVEFMLCNIMLGCAKTIILISKAEDIYLYVSRVSRVFVAVCTAKC